MCWLTVRAGFAALVFRMLIFAVIYWNFGAPRIDVSKPTPIWREEKNGYWIDLRSVLCEMSSRCSTRRELKITWIKKPEGGLIQNPKLLKNDWKLASDLFFKRSSTEQRNFTGDNGWRQAFLPTSLQRLRSKTSWVVNKHRIWPTNTGEDYAFLYLLKNPNWLRVGDSRGR